VANIYNQPLLDMFKQGSVFFILDK